jgi:hypothetical protein
MLKFNDNKGTAFSHNNYFFGKFFKLSAKKEISEKKFSDK